MRITLEIREFGLGLDVLASCFNPYFVDIAVKCILVDTNDVNK